MNSNLVAALIGAAAVIIVAILQRQNRKLEQIHILVNSRLSEALDEIHALKNQLGDTDPPR